MLNVFEDFIVNEREITNSTDVTGKQSYQAFNQEVLSTYQALLGECSHKEKHK